MASVMTENNSGAPMMVGHILAMPGGSGGISATCVAAA